MSEKLSIIMPVYNEEKTLVLILKKVFKIDYLIPFELVIVNDGSKDRTSNILRYYKNKNNIKIINHQTNKGKGAAVITGIKHSKGNIIIIQDADLEYDPSDIPKLLNLILKGDSDVVYGSRFLNKKYSVFGKHHVILPSHVFGNKFLSFVTNMLYGSNITDMETCYKMFRKEVVNHIKLNARGFDIEPEITAKILKKGYKIKEVNINHNPRSFSEGKKITKLDGFKALITLLKYRFSN